jgi:hypothetical protein
VRNDEIQNIIDNPVFSMEMSGFTVTDEEKETIRKVLNGEIPYEEQLRTYIEEAKRRGARYNKINEN